MHALYPLLRVRDSLYNVVQVSASFKGHESNWDLPNIVCDCQVSIFWVPSKSSRLSLWGLRACRTSSALFWPKPFLNQTFILRIRLLDKPSLDAFPSEHIKHQDLVVVPWGDILVILIKYSQTPDLTVMMRMHNGFLDLLRYVTLNNVPVPHANKKELGIVDTSWDPIHNDLCYLLHVHWISYLDNHVCSPW